MSAEDSQTSQTLKLQSKIGWICQGLRWLIIIWLVWVLVIILMSFFDAAKTVDEVNALASFKDYPVTFQSVIASACVNLLSWVCAIPIGFAGWRLATAYLNGDIFSELAAIRMKQLGQAAIFATLVGVALRPISIWLFSSGYFHTLRIWHFLSPQDLLYFLIGIFILSLAHIYHAAAEISAENKEFI